MNREGTAKLEQMMEEAVRPSNWEAALSAVERNDGVPGPDGMRASQLRKHLGLHGEVIKERPFGKLRATVPEPRGGGTLPSPTAAPVR